MIIDSTGKCSCGFRYSTRGEYSEHMKNGRHNNVIRLQPIHAKSIFDAELPYCSVCKRNFNTQREYQDHHYKGKCGGYL